MFQTRGGRRAPRFFWLCPKGKKRPAHLGKLKRFKKIPLQVCRLCFGTVGEPARPSFFWRGKNTKKSINNNKFKNIFNFWFVRVFFFLFLPPDLKLNNNGKNNQSKKQARN